jgi:hypothetical protein
MKKAISILTILAGAFAFAQVSPDSLSVNPQTQINAAERILTGNINSGVTVGGYGEITYNQPESKNGELDVQRLVLLFGYKFSDKVQFVTEIELEHVEEVFVEQAFVQYKLGENINARGGLMLIPMGITNEFHEPTTFNGVERPSIDGSIVPTTWREIGVGVQGRFNEISLGYQAYIFNGFRSVNGTKVLGGSNGLRNGRQKGIKSTVDSPNLSAKVDYYGLPGLRIGLAGYFGRTQVEDDVEKIDGTSIGISMVGLDARYAYKRITARGQFIHASLSDTEDYNTLYSADLGSTLQGWYLEGAYNLLPVTKDQQLFAFARYSDYDTHASVTGGLTKNESYNRDEWTFGLSFKMAPGAVLKADYQLKGNAVTNSDTVGQFNVGLGVWF